MIDLKNFRARAAIGAMLVAAVLVIIDNVSLGDFIETRFTHRIVFGLRQFVRGPGLDPRIKIFSFDDRTVARLNALDLALSDWARVIQAVAAREPAGIFFDKLYDKPYTDEEMDEFVQRMRVVRSPVYIGGFVSREEIKLRATIDTSAKRYQLSSLLSEGETTAPRWLDVSAGWFYGTHEKMAKVFSGIGHVVYDTPGFFSPLIRISDSIVVPHIALSAAQDLKIRRGKFIANNHEISVNSRGFSVINVDRRDVYVKRAYSMSTLIEYALKGREISVVERGDYVLILPAMYTGNTDWRETALGSYPGGYIIASQMNEVLTGQWIHQIGWSSVLIVLACALACFLAVILRSARFWLSWAIGFVVIAGAGITLFVGFDVMISWLLPLTGYVVAGLISFSVRHRSEQLTQVRMEQELETAHIVQDAFFPPDHTATEHFHFAGFYRPASECSGDWWGHFSPTSGQHYVMIGDAVGHGVPAALVTAMLYSAIQTIAYDILHETDHKLAPGKFLTKLNDVLCKMSRDKWHITFLVGAFDAASGDAILANAGHTMPLVIKSDDQDAKNPRTIVVRGDVLGMSADQKYVEKTVPFGPGDKIFFYTDGLIENTDSHSKALGKTVLTRMLKEYHSHKTEPFLREIVRAAGEFFGKQPLNDDYTIVVVGRD